MNLAEQGLSPRSIAWSAVAMYAGGGLIGLVAAAIPGGPSFSVIPSCVALIVAGLLAVVGPRLSKLTLAPLGPAGVVLVAHTLATRNGAGDAAVLYMLPVLWTSHFYGRKGAVLIVVLVGVAHAVAVHSFPQGLADIDRWLDVVVAAIVVAVVVQLLVRHADQLVSRLQRSESRFRELADRSPDVVFSLSRLPDAHFVYQSPSFERITGIPVAAVVADSRVFARAYGAAGRAEMDDLIAGRDFRPRRDIPFRRVDGTLGVFELHVVKTPVGAQGTARDVTEIRALQAQLAEQAMRDPLTGLANRRLLDELLGQAIGRINRSGTHLTVAVLDLDGFKSVNDTHGHDAGDAVLRTMAARLQTAVRDADVVARYGGDEFVVVSEGADDDAIRTPVERIHTALSAPVDIGGGVTVRCRASIGIADTRRTDPDASALISAADRAMLEAKKQHTPSSG